jgi:hypothetical protein
LASSAPGTAETLRLLGKLDPSVNVFASKRG